MEPSTLPEPYTEAIIQLRRKASILKEQPQNFKIIVFHERDFFCFSQLDEEFSVPLIVVHAANVHHINFNKEKIKFQLLIKNKGGYSFRVQDIETAMRLEKLLVEKMDKFKNLKNSFKNINENEMRAFAINLLAEKEKEVSKIELISVQTPEDAPVAKITNKYNSLLDITTRYNQSIGSGRFSSFMSHIEKEVGNDQSKVSSLERYAAPKGPKFLELEKFLEVVRNDELLKKHVWSGIVNHYKMSNIMGNLEIDDEITNYTTSFFAIIFTSKPLNIDFENLSLPEMRKVFENRYWQSAVPHWMEINNVYMFEVREKLDFRKLVQAHPYSHIIPLKFSKK
jgi:hypothetical protein